MLERFRKPLAWLRGHLTLLLVLAVLLALLGLGVTIGARNWSARTHYRQAQEALAANKLEEARRHLDLCLGVWDKDAEVHFLTARTTRRLGDFAAAQRQLDICKELGWDAGKLRLERALIQAQSDNPAPLERYLLQLVKGDDPDSIFILEALIQGYLNAYQLPQAVACAESWLQREPESPPALYWRGLVRLKGLHYKEAAEDFRRAIEADPDNREARLRLGEVLLEQNWFEDAVAQYEWLYEREPENSEVMMGLAQCRAALSQLDQAQQLLDRLLRDHPNSPQVLSERGKLALILGKAAEAEDWLRRAVAIDPYVPETIYAYSQALAQLGKSDQARDWLDKHQRILADLKRLRELNDEIVAHPNDPKPRYEIGVIFLRTGREKQGIHWLGTSLRMDPRYHLAHGALAEYYERHGLTREAAHHRQQAGPP